MKRKQVNKNLENWIKQAFVYHGNRGSKMAIILNSKFASKESFLMTDLTQMKTKLRIQITKENCFCESNAF